MRKKTGFTLVELLVVISIIALLTSILLPSLAQARLQARSVHCMMNLRTLSHGWHMYADDNHDVLLPGRYAKEAGGTGNPANWYEVGNGLKYRPRWVATFSSWSISNSPLQTLALSSSQVSSPAVRPWMLCCLHPTHQR